MADKAHSASGITGQLQNWSKNQDADANNALLDMVYGELHRQAHRYLRNERKGHTLQTTALIHEVYLKLTEQRSIEWESRTHFFGIAANLMRHILVDYAKAKHRLKRGGKADNLPLEEAFLVASKETNIDLLAMDEALNRLAEMDEQQSRIVELRYFSGLSVEETAEVLGVSESTVKRDWNVAKAWLKHELSR